MKPERKLPNYFTFGLMDRRVDVDQLKEMLIKTREAGVETGTFIMVRYPGETIEDIYITAKYLEETLPDHLTITKSYSIKVTLKSQISEMMMPWDTR